MLATIGAKTAEDLISYLPSDVRFNAKLAIEDGKSEYEIVDYFKALAAKNLDTAQAKFEYAGKLFKTEAVATGLQQVQSARAAEESLLASDENEENEEAGDEESQAQSEAPEETGVRE